MAHVAEFRVVRRTDTKQYLAFDDRTEYYTDDVSKAYKYDSIPAAYLVVRLLGSENVPAEVSKVTYAHKPVG